MNDPAHIRDCVQRVTQSLARRPPEAKPDAPARAVWTGGLAAQLVSDQPPTLQTDMPAALGGGDAAPSPGWYFRAGAASCLVTTIAMNAAARGITLRRLEVDAHSTSDPRGMLGSTEGVPAGPQQMWLDVTVEADGVDEAALRELVAYAEGHAPMSGALRRAVPLECRVNVPEPAGT